MVTLLKLPKDINKNLTHAQSHAGELQQSLLQVDPNFPKDFWIYSIETGVKWFRALDDDAQKEVIAQFFDELRGEAWLETNDGSEVVRLVRVRLQQLAEVVSFGEGDDHEWNLYLAFYKKAAGADRGLLNKT